MPGTKSKRLRVLVALNADQAPRKLAKGAGAQARLHCKTETHVCGGLAELGFEVRHVGLEEDVTLLRQTVDEWRPDLVFNLIMRLGERHGVEAQFAGYLELLGVPFTGCDAETLVRTRDKAFCKQILAWHGIRTPEFALWPRGRRRALGGEVSFPAIVKPTDLGCSVGIAEASIVSTDGCLRKRVEYVHGRLECDAIIERFVPGRDLTVGVWGGRRLDVLPVWETVYGPRCKHRVSTERIKWHLKHREEMGVESRRADLDASTEKRAQKLARATCEALGLFGIARVDLRLGDDGELYVLEANPNPDLDFDEDFVRSAAAADWTPPQVLERIVHLGLRRSPASRG